MRREWPRASQSPLVLSHMLGCPPLLLPARHRGVLLLLGLEICKVLGVHPARFCRLELGILRRREPVLRLVGVGVWVVDWHDDVGLRLLGMLRVEPFSAATATATAAAAAAGHCRRRWWGGTCQRCLLVGLSVERPDPVAAATAVAAAAANTAAI